jgi:hypothetical protein
MSLLGAIGTVVGLANSIGANRRGDAAQREAMRQRAQMLRQEEAFNSQLQALYQQQLASGMFDPQNLLNALQRSSEIQMKAQAGNMAGAARAAGYRAGDSRLQNNLQRLSESAAARLAVQQQQANLGLGQAQSAALRGTRPSMSALELNARANDALSGQFLNDPSAILANSISAGTFDFLNKPKKKKPKVELPFGPNRP